MSRQREALEIQGSEVQGSEVQGSEVQGSGRTIFTLVHMVFNLIDDELTVSDYHKFAGKKVDMGKRLWRLTSGAVNKASNADGRMLGDCSLLDQFTLNCSK